jgi:hypothetical protein
MSSNPPATTHFFRSASDRVTAICDTGAPERGGQTVTVLVEDEERVIADGLEVAVVGGLLLGAVHRTLGAVNIEGHPPGGRSRRRVLNQFRVQVSESLIVTLLREGVRLEPVER